MDTRKNSLMGKLLKGACASVALFGLAATSFGAVLVDFKPDPTTTVDPEFIYSGVTGLGAGNGATGDGSVLTAGGLRIETPFLLALVPGAILNVAQGTSSFLDVTLTISGLVPTGAAIMVPTTPVTLIQPLTGPGTFTLRTAAEPNLLTGTISSGQLDGQDGRTRANVGAQITYTSGRIYDALFAAGGVLTGDFSFTMLDVGTVVADNSGLKKDLGTGQIAGFQANGVGLFNTPAIPEPSSLSILGLIGAGLVARRRSR
jgi:hypothetical protein